MRCTYFVD